MKLPWISEYCLDYSMSLTYEVICIVKLCKVYRSNSFAFGNVFFIKLAELVRRPSSPPDTAHTGDVVDPYFWQVTFHLIFVEEYTTTHFL